MNILITSTTYPPSTGGAQLHMHYLAQQLKTRHQVQVVSHWDANRTDWLLGTTLRAPEVDRDYEIDGITVHRMGISHADKIHMAPYLPLYYPIMDFALPPIARRIQTHLEPYAQKADLIHNVRIGREGLSYASYYAAKRHNIPFVLTPVHHPRWVGWRYRAYNKLYRLADAVLVLTNAEKQIMLDLGVREERVTVVGHGPILAPQADPEGFRRRYQLNEPFVLFLGQHYAYKGFRQLLEATALVWQKYPEVHFVFVGPSVADSEEVFKGFPDKRIHRLGAVDLQTKTDALAACTLMCLPSTQESFGGVYVEAWSLGKPVIGCNIPAVAEVIEEGVDGYLVTQAPGPIAERIGAIMTDRTKADMMGANGKMKAKERYSWQHISNRSEQAYALLA